MAERGYAFFQNRNCEFFPCHKTANEADFNCLFCYCPLYALAERCGGNPKFLPNGVKDCSDCLRPHCRGKYDEILEEMPKIMELGKKSTER